MSVVFELIGFPLGSRSASVALMVIAVVMQSRTHSEAQRLPAPDMEASERN